MSLLKILRVLFASFFFLAMGSFFLGWTDLLPIYGSGGPEERFTSASWHLLAHFQMVPAILGASTGILALWTVLTFLFGRVYCSCVCPLGILQDLFSRISKAVRGKKAKFRFHVEMSRTRYSLLFVFLISLVGIPLGVTILDPYGHFGRIMVSLVRPLFLFGYNLWVSILGGPGSSSFHYGTFHVEYAAVVASGLALLMVALLSFFLGRRYCNTICPVGTLLGILSKHSLFQIRLNSNCISCGICEKNCKGECIDAKNRIVDASRCVSCFNCLQSCRRKSLVYSIDPRMFAEKNPQPTVPEPAEIRSEICIGKNPRRSFLRWSVFSLFLPSVAGSLGAARSSPAPPDSSLPTGVSRIGYKMQHPILPPGAESREHFQRRCTACHLCVSKCPANILRPSTTDLGLNGFLQPVVKFDHNFCNFDCTVCTEVCPSHALIPKTKEQKHRLQIGRVVFLLENCVVQTQGSNCGACAEHCPSGAVSMVPFGPPEKSLTIPQIDPELCVGCGACEYICPVRPFRAIYVDGLPEHAEAKLGYDPETKQETVELDDFGF